MQQWGSYNVIWQIQIARLTQTNRLVTVTVAAATSFPRAWRSMLRGWAHSALGCAMRSEYGPCCNRLRIRATASRGRIYTWSFSHSLPGHIFVANSRHSQRPQQQSRCGGSSQAEAAPPSEPAAFRSSDKLTAPVKVGGMSSHVWSLDDLGDEAPLPSPSRPSIAPSLTADGVLSMGDLGAFCHGARHPRLPCPRASGPRRSLRRR